MVPKIFAIALIIAVALPTGSAPAMADAYCDNLCTNLPLRSLSYDGRDDCERELDEAGYRCETSVVPYPSAPRRAPGPHVVRRGAYAPDIPDSGFFGLY
jgi:hypothetical protein